jgi:nitrite reductase/ring-hydroxylating ferredoxin subunit
MKEVSEGSQQSAYWLTRPLAPAPGTVLGRCDDVPPDGSKEFVFGSGPGAFRMFVVRNGVNWFAYLNLCPHYSLPLNVRPDEFLSRDGTRIMCRRHLAIFRMEDGLCIDGACSGSTLDAIPVSVDPAGMLKIG